MEKKVFNCIELDLYGEFLTDRQREIADLYYNQDMSLAEIAQGFGITRQGVRDALQRAQHTLDEMEQKLRLAERELSLRSGVEQCLTLMEQGDYARAREKLLAIQLEIQQ